MAGHYQLSAWTPDTPHSLANATSLTTRSPQRLKQYLLTRAPTPAVRKIYIWTSQRGELRLRRSKLLTWYAFCFSRSRPSRALIPKVEISMNAKNELIYIVCLLIPLLVASAAYVNLP